VERILRLALLDDREPRARGVRACERLVDERGATLVAVEPVDQTPERFGDDGAKLGGERALARAREAADEQHAAAHEPTAAHLGELRALRIGIAKGFARPTRSPGPRSLGLPRGFGGLR
jgi:hypothetical protein